MNIIKWWINCSNSMVTNMLGVAFDNALSHYLEAN